MKDRNGSSREIAGDMLRFNVLLSRKRLTNVAQLPKLRRYNPQQIINARTIHLVARLTAIERLQRSADARDDVVPGALFARRVFEIKTVDRVS